jgi:hypothetical protein
MRVICAEILYNFRRELQFLGLLVGVIGWCAGCEDLVWRPKQHRAECDETSDEYQLRYPERCWHLLERKDRTL